MRIVPPNPPLEDGVVRLRPWSDDDVAGLVAACNEAEIGRWLDQIPQPYTEGDARRYVRECGRGWETGQLSAFAVIDPRAGTLLGSIGVRWLDWNDSVAEVGYWVSAHARGRHIATRALRLVSRWALSEIGVARLQLRADTGNVASRRVAEGAGFTLEGVLRSARYDRRAELRRDFAFYSLLAGELPET